MRSAKIEESRIKFAFERCPTPILEPLELIKRSLKYFENTISVSCSFGACSVAVLHMVLQLKPNIPVVFCNTTVDYPETYEYRDRLVNEWGINLVETKPIKPFWDVIKEYGLPTIRRQYYHSYQRLKGLNWKRDTFQEKTGKPACCWFCKDKPFLDACKKFGIKATLTGLRVAESRARMYFGADYGQFHYTKRYKIMKYHPILFWTKEQLDAYFEKYNIPKNEVYTKLGLQRNGCMPCTGFLTWEKQLARINLPMYRYIQKLRGTTLIDDYIQMEEKILTEGCDDRITPKKEVLREWF